jgi:hypothetical protein
MPNIDSPILDAARREPLPPMPERQCKNFEAAKDSAFREGEKDSRAASLANNGGDQNRGPIQGGPEPSGKGGPLNKATGLDGGGGFFQFKWDVGGDGHLHASDPQVGVTGHTEWLPGKGAGAGMKDGKPGVATGDGHGGSVTTVDDVKKATSSSSSSTASPTCSNKSNAPEGLKWVDQNKDLKDAIPPAAAPQINDLGPSTNEPDQKTDNGAVARNDEARFGDDIAQRI